MVALRRIADQYNQYPLSGNVARGVSHSGRACIAVEKSSTVCVGDGTRIVVDGLPVDRRWVVVGSESNHEAEPVVERVGESEIGERPTPIVESCDELRRRGSAWDPSCGG